MNIQTRFFPLRSARTKSLFVLIILTIVFALAVSLLRREPEKPASTMRDVTAQSALRQPARQPARFAAAGFDRARALRTKGAVQEVSAAEVTSSRVQPTVEKSLWRIKGYMRSAAEEKTFLKEKIALLGNLLEAKEKETEHLTQENTSLKNDVEKIQKEQTKLKGEFAAQLSTLNVQLAQRDLALSEFNTTKRNLEAELNSLGTKIAGLSSAHDAVQSQLANAVASKTNLEEAVRKLTDDLVRQNAANEALRKNVEELTVALREKESQRQLVAGELEQLGVFKKNIEAELVSLKNNKSELSLAAHDLETRLAEAVSAKNSLERELQNVKEELTKQLAVNEALNRSVEELKDRADQAESRGRASADVQAQLDAYRTQAEARVKELTGAQTESEKKIQELLNRIEELARASDVTKKSSSELSEIIAQKELLINEKQREIEKLTGFLQKTTGERNNLVLALEERERSINGLRAALKNMEAQGAILQQELGSGRGYEADVSRQLEQAKALNNSLKKKISNLYVELELLRVESAQQARSQ